MIPRAGTTARPPWHDEPGWRDVEIGLRRILWATVLSLAMGVIQQVLLQVLIAGQHDSTWIGAVFTAMRPIWVGSSLLIALALWRCRAASAASGARAPFTVAAAVQGAVLGLELLFGLAEAAARAGWIPRILEGSVQRVFWGILSLAGAGAMIALLVALQRTGRHVGRDVPVGALVLYGVALAGRVLLNAWQLADLPGLGLPHLARSTLWLVLVVGTDVSLIVVLAAAVRALRPGLRAPEGTWATLPGWNDVASGLRLYASAAVTGVGVLVTAVILAFGLARVREVDAAAGVMGLAGIVGLVVGVVMLVALWRLGGAPRESGGQGPITAALLFQMIALSANLDALVAMGEGTRDLTDRTLLALVAQLAAAGLTVSLLLACGRLARVIGAAALGDRARGMLALFGVIAVGGPLFVAAAREVVPLLLVLALVLLIVALVFFVRFILLARAVADAIDEGVASWRDPGAGPNAVRFNL